jgi:hypothetical protein
MTTRLRLGGLAALLVVGTAVPVLAQRITITPRVGAYIPLTNQGGIVTFAECDPVECGGSDDFTLVPGVSAGLTVVVQSDSPLGLEASITTAALQRRRETQFWVYPFRSDPDPTVGYSPTRTTAAALRIRFAGSVGARVDVAVGAGLAVTYLSGEGYRVHSPLEHTTVGPSVAANLGVVLRPGVRFEFGVEHRYHGFEPANWPVGYRESLGQHDLVISAGVGLVLRP